MKFKLVLTMLLLVASTYFAQSGSENFKDGNHLLKHCKVAVDSADNPNWKDAHEAFSTGFCEGLVDGIASVSSNVCLTEGVTVGQEVRVVLEYLGTL
jgi:hypothetical protein